MQTQMLKRPDGNIAYDDQGQGPVVLCVPAGGDMRSEYRFFAPLLVAAGYRVVTMDLRGQGESSANWPDYSAAAVGSDMLALLDHLHVESAFLVGASVATAAAIWAAAEAPDRVRGLVLIGGSARAAQPLVAQLSANLYLSPLWGRRVYSSFFPKMYPLARPADFDEHRKKVDAMLKEPGRLRSMRRLFAEVGQEWDARIARVTAPALILMGSRDPDFGQPEEEARRLAARFTAAHPTVRIFEGAGHHLQAELPEQVAESVLAFLAQSAPQAAIPQEA
jgi:pimeloyl-ACP methyl ester carboxylesterase